MVQLEEIPEINVPWATLAAAATTMRDHASRAVSVLDALSAKWDGLQHAYREISTQDRVYTALLDLRDPIVDWAVALSAACAALEDFAAEGMRLQREANLLAGERAGLSNSATTAAGDDEAMDAAARGGIAFNMRVQALRQDWARVLETVVSDLAGITGGTGDTLPVFAALGGPVLPAPDWIRLTSGLDDLGELEPGSVVDAILSLTDQELRDWARVNPEAAMLLARNEVPRSYSPASGEYLMNLARSWGYDRPEGVLAADLAPEGIAEIRRQWLSLSALEQRRLLLLYPSVFGNLNGIPMAQRAAANIVTVAGYREELARQLAAMGGEPQMGDFASNPGEQALYSASHAVWEQLARKKDGLDYAVLSGVQVVMVSLEGDGRVVTMNGTPSASTGTSAVLVPGTGADLSSLEAYSQRLNHLVADGGPQHLSFYWQGSDLPDEVKHNASSQYNEAGGPLLAGFDAALDLELAAGTRSTYIGYSAGAALVGTAEREGLDSTRIIYLAPSGVGNDVGSVADTHNPEAVRFWIQARDDPITWALLLGGVSQGGDPEQMHATRLESGYIDHELGGALVSGHEQYFHPQSTAMENMWQVVHGGRVYPYVPDEMFVDEGGNWPYSPLETVPEDYAGSGMPSVPIEGTQRLEGTQR